MTFNQQQAQPSGTSTHSQSSLPGLSGTSTSQSSQPGQSGTGTHSQSSLPGPSGVNAGYSGQPVGSSTMKILQMKQVSEHKRLFSFPNGVGRRKGSNYSKKDKVKKQPSCTLKFVALSEVHALKPPTKIRERTALLNAGLGEASIQLCLDMNS